MKKAKNPRSLIKVLAKISDLMIFRLSAAKRESPIKTSKVVGSFTLGKFIASSFVL
ncbi:MAG: hypothetical protein ACD_57C00300G0001 [uncultured bacterium]|nr:MAG: hypothetical protein ACD_57C00300G0001 [uncultured bacterium]